MEEEKETQYLTKDQIDALREFLSNADFKTTDFSVFLSMIDNFVRANQKCDEKYLSVFRCIENLEFLGSDGSGIEGTKKTPFAIAASICLFGLLSLVGVFSIEEMSGGEDPMARFMKSTSIPKA